MRAWCVIFTLLYVFLDRSLSKMCHDHSGKEFIIVPFTITTFGEVFQIHIAANPAVTSTIEGTIRTPIIRDSASSKFSSPFSVTPPNRLSINIQNFEAVSVNVVTDTAIVITTSDDVVISVSYGKTGSLGSMLLFPTETLGTEYRVVTFSPIPPTTDKAILVIAAAYSDTNVQLFPGSEQVELEINGIHYTGTETASVNLAQYESVVISSSEDLTGIRVLATKPVAVYSGNVDLSIYNDGETDVVLEQMPPVSELGQKHIVVSNPKIKKDFIKIVSTEDKTELYVNTIYHSIDLAGQFVITEIVSDGSGTYAIVNSSHPVLVALYGDNSMNTENVEADVTMTVIPPMKNFGSSFVVITPTKSLPVSYTHNLVVISPQGLTGDLRLDGSSTGLLGLSWMAVTDVNMDVNHEVVSSIVIPEGVHVLTSVNETHQLGGYLYGTAAQQSYGTTLATFTDNKWTTPGLCSTSKFVKIADDKLPFPAELSQNTTRTYFRCYQLCSISTTCGLVAVYRHSSTSVECRLYESETQCGPFQNVSGFKLFARQK